MDANQLLLRTKKFALDIIRFFQILPKTDEARILGKQLLRAATSVAANYRAASRARSKPEFFSKLCIVVEECDESLFWLELISESGIIDSKKSDSICIEATELLRIFSTSRKTVKISLNKSANSIET
jgi:four helix bundle protein